MTARRHFRLNVDEYARGARETDFTHWQAKLESSFLRREQRRPVRQIAAHDFTASASSDSRHPQDS
jgi:hypothetical protein